jgi:Rab family, other
MDSQSTVGMEFSTRSIEFEKCMIKAQLWDTAGQERFESMTKAYYRNALGAVLVYDICNKESFFHLKSIWMNQLKEFGHENMKLILVGNKYDLIERDAKAREITIEEAISFARDWNMDFVETSALSGYRVEAMFRRLIFSVAKLVPEVKTHLELLNLPDGFIIQFDNNNLEEAAESGSSSPSNNNYNNNNNNPNQNSLVNPNPISGVSISSNQSRVLSVDDYRTTLETVSSSYKSSLATVSAASAASSCTSSSSTTAVENSGVRSRSRNHSFVYLNYWTGEVVYDPPTTPASTLMIYAASQNVAQHEAEEEVVDESGTNQHNRNNNNNNNRLKKEDSMRSSFGYTTERSSSMKTDQFADLNSLNVLADPPSNNSNNRNNSSNRDNKDNLNGRKSAKSTKRCQNCSIL